MSRYFLTVGRLEGISLLILFFIAMPLKYMMGLPLAVRVVGSVHGILFVGYVWLAFDVMLAQNWPKKKFLTCVILSALPFGTFYFEKYYLKTAS